MGLVRSTVCYYCLGGCSALVVCARRSRLAWGVRAGAGFLRHPLGSSLPSRPSRCVLRVVPPGVLPFACRYAIPFGLCVPQARSGPPSGPRRVSVGWVRSCSRGVRATPSPPGRYGARTARGSGAGRW